MLLKKKSFGLFAMLIVCLAAWLAGGTSSKVESQTAKQTESPAQLRVLQVGAGKKNPYTIIIVNNPALTELGPAGKYLSYPDPINDQKDKFEASVDYIYANLFGRVPDQAEKFLADDSIRDKIRVISIWKNDLPATPENSLVRVKTQFEGRQGVLAGYLENLQKDLPGENLNADVVFAVTGYKNDALPPSAFWSIDDQARGGVPFTLDGRTYTHCFYSSTPGMVAIHADHRSMMPLHEFCHAASSWPNGYIADLYNNDNNVASLLINKKLNYDYRDHVPKEFAVYNDVQYYSDRDRDKDAKLSIHAERINPKYPALMDNYNRYPMQSEHDKLTRRFLIDRIYAKTSR